jgi:hypothetical protein
VISRILVILLAFVVAAVQLSRGAWVEASGLAGLGAGLLILRARGNQPTWRRLAWAAFSVTGLAILVVLLRMRRAG